MFDLNQESNVFFELMELGLYFFNKSLIPSAKLLSEVCKWTEKPLGRGPTPGSSRQNGVESSAFRLWFKLYFPLLHMSYE